MTADEKPALERVQRSDVAVVDAAFASNRDELVALCRPIVGDDAEDLAHDAYLLARSRVAQLREPQRAGAWLAKIALNLCFQRHRRLDHLSRLLPFLHREARARHPEVREALATLPVQQRTVVVLFYGQGLSIADIAALLDRNPSTIRSILFRARAHLRRTMGLNDAAMEEGIE
jgi:RNA polymerase sigma-70 factor, ECF subfamily